MRKLLTALTLLIGGLFTFQSLAGTYSTTDKWFRLTITKKASNGDHIMQFARLGLYSEDGTRQNLGLALGSSASALKAGQCYAEVPSGAGIGKPVNNLFTAGFSTTMLQVSGVSDLGLDDSSLKVVITMRLSDSADSVSKYNLATSHETQWNRPPVAWTLESSNDGVDWAVVDQQTPDTCGLPTTIKTWYNGGGTGDDPTAFFDLVEPKVCEHKNTEAIDAVEPTCTEPGRTAGLKCLGCGKILEAPTVIPAKEHAFDHENFEWDPEVTDDTDGYKVYSCTNVNRGVQCDATERELVRAYNTFLGFEGKWYRFTITGTKGADNPQLSEFALYDIDGNRQNLKLVYENQSDATKLGAGKFYNAKNTNGNVFDGNRGTKYYGETPSYVMHLADNAKPVLQYNICSGNDTFSQPNRAPTAWTLEVSENGSDWTVIDTQVEATSEYTTANMTWYKNGGNADNPSAFYVLAEPKTDCPHENTAPIVEAKEPTCTEPGTTAGLKCLDCEAILEAPAAISALGHNYDESTFVWDPEATPKQDGWKAHVCTNVISGEVCGDMDHYEFVRAIGQPPYETWVRFTIMRKGASVGAGDLNSIALSRFALVDREGAYLNLGLTELKDKDVTAKDLTPGQFFYEGASAGSPVSNLFKDMDNGNEKWFAQKDGLSGLAAEDADKSLYQVITMRLNEWANPTGYKLKAADIAGLPGRNPISWTIEVSRDGKKWRLADTQTNVTAPTANYTWYTNEDKGSFIFPIPSRGGLTVIVR